MPWSQRGRRLGKSPTALLVCTRGLVFAYGETERDRLKEGNSAAYGVVAQVEVHRIGRMTETAIALTDVTDTIEVSRQR